MTIIHFVVLSIVFMFLGMLICICVDFFSLNESILSVFCVIIMGVLSFSLSLSISNVDKQKEEEIKQSLSSIENKLSSGYSLKYEDDVITSKGTKKDVLREYEKSPSDYYIDYDAKDKIVKIIKK